MMNIRGEAVAMVGLFGAGLTFWLGMEWAPSVSIEAFRAPDAQRIFYWHVPSAWAAMIAFGMLFVGSALWFFKRTEWAWRLHVASSEAGLATGLMCVWSGCIWGAAEWGIPWDWTDIRLNTFAMLTLLSLYLVLGRRSQPDGIETRDTFAAFGMYGFVLVPITYISTRLWQIRHPGPVVATSEGSLNSDMGTVLLIGAISFTVLIIGHVMAGMRLAKLEMRLEDLQIRFEEESV
jgi:heme exporter protein C